MKYFVNLKDKESLLEYSTYISTKQEETTSIKGSLSFGSALTTMKIKAGTIMVWRKVN